MAFESCCVVFALQPVDGLLCEIIIVLVWESGQVRAGAVDLGAWLVD